MRLCGNEPTPLGTGVIGRTYIRASMFLKFGNIRTMRVDSTVTVVRSLTLRAVDGW